MLLRAGSQLGSYDVTGPLPAAGIGELYRAHDDRLNRDVAIKALSLPFASDANRMARFRRDAQAMATLSHPNIAAIYGMEEGRGMCALVMELVEGPTLEERIAGGPLPLAEALAIARQISEALAAAHDKGMMHGDLKAANIQVGSGGHVKVFDFGLATALGGEPGDKQSDIRAFGMVLRAMLAGGAARPLPVRNLIDRCMDGQLSDIADAWIEIDAPVVAPVVTAPPAPVAVAKPPRPMPWIAIGVGVLIAIAVIAWVVLR
jgi:serine/threonine protein kinase